MMMGGVPGPGSTQLQEREHVQLRRLREAEAEREVLRARTQQLEQTVAELRRRRSSYVSSVLQPQTQRTDAEDPLITTTASPYASSNASDSAV